MRWSLLKGPSGLTVNERTGLVSWTYTYARSTAYEIQVKASNIIGQHTLFWSLQVPLAYSVYIDRLEPDMILPGPRPVEIYGHVEFLSQLSERVVPVDVL